MTNQQIATRMLEIERETRAARAVIARGNEELTKLERMLRDNGPKATKQRTKP